MPRRSLSLTKLLQLTGCLIMNEHQCNFKISAYLDAHQPKSDNCKVLASYLSPLNNGLQYADLQRFLLNGLPTSICMQIPILLDCFQGITYMYALFRSSISGFQKTMHLLTNCMPSPSFSEHHMQLGSILTFSGKFHSKLNKSTYLLLRRVTLGLNLKLLYKPLPGITYMYALFRSSISGFQKTTLLLTGFMPSPSFSEHHMQLGSISTSWKPMNFKQFSDNRD
ncbi:hypothetical protein T4B_15107 [Trichinella pseudospiralis]|uniref:Uncharacterized protein n=1 Tax=Trichinella pseudospiralis TaxID=6337 RepID=A0A0V1IAW9_TRIPS|nr:hypothetical protein T4B_15107 [Trichinella pseudospiralis]